MLITGNKYVEKMIPDVERRAPAFNSILWQFPDNLPWSINMYKALQINVFSGVNPVRDSGQNQCEAHKI